MKVSPLLGLGLLALCGCSGDLNPVRDAFVAAGAGAQPRKPQDFVAQSRRPAEDLDYVPVRVTPTPRPLRSKTAPEVKAAEAEMEAARVGNDASAAAANAPVAPAPVPPPAPLPAAASR